MLSPRFSSLSGTAVSSQRVGSPQVSKGNFWVMQTLRILTQLFCFASSMYEVSLNTYMDLQFTTPHTSPPFVRPPSFLITPLPGVEFGNYKRRASHSPLLLPPSAPAPTSRYLSWALAPFFLPESCI